LFAEKLQVFLWGVVDDPGAEVEVENVVEGV
jgi:hypothetical protein